jgi:hypothetical protein
MDDGRYRAIFHSPLQPADAFHAGRDEIRIWLRSKNFDLGKFDDGDPHVGAGAVLLHHSANSADGSRTSRWQLRESRADGAWLSSLTVHAPASGDDRSRSWFWIEIEFETSIASTDVDTTSRAAVPRLARGLLATVPAFDALTSLTSEPRVIGSDGIDELIDALCDPDRRLPVVVSAAHPELEFGEWRQVVAHVMRYLPGLAGTYLLDPLATRKFADEIGRSHAVWGGAVRTYLPDVDPAVAEEAQRHRVLTGPRILADPGKAAGLLSVLPRRLAAESPLPPALAGVNRTLLSRTPRSLVSTTEGAVERQLAEVIEERELALNLAEEQQERANTFFEQRESALAELAERDQRVVELEDLLRSLRRRMVASGQAQEAFLPADDQSNPPVTFAELSDWMELDLAHVVFTGDRTSMLALDRSPEADTWVRSTWEILRALESYAKAKTARSFVGDFKQWCEQPPSDSYAVPAGKVARDESESVRRNAKWRHEREFAIPNEVDASGRIFMGAHVRIGASAAGQISPRLYFLDATGATISRIYVGYIGRHLTNTRT